MKRSWTIFLLVNLILSACAPASAPISTSTPNATPVPSATPLPTAIIPTGGFESTATPVSEQTPVPTEASSTPEQQLAEYLQTVEAKQSIDQFVEALKNAGIKISAEEIMAKIIFKQSDNSIDGVYNIDLKDGAQDLPLFTYVNNKWLTTLKPHATNAGINLGVKVNQEAVDGKNDDPKYAEIVTSQFNFCITDGELIDPDFWKENGFNFKEADKVINFAKKNNLPVQVHHLLYPSREPQWLLEEKNHLSREQAIEILKNHIKLIVNRYKDDTVTTYTVVNEALDWDHLYGFWQETIGSDYIDIAFRTAHEVDPEAILLYSDSNEGKNGAIDDHENAVYNLVKKLKDDGVPINGIAMELHIDASKPFNKQGLEKNMLRYKNLGLEVYVTELDVAINKLGIPDTEKQKIKAQIYREVLAALIETGAGNSLGIFGVNPNYSWKPESDPLIYDKNNNPNLAYYSLLQYLYQLSNK